MAYRCPHDPRQTIGPIGMYHCPECVEMVLACDPHPPVVRCKPRRNRDDPYIDISDRPDQWSDEDEFEYDLRPALEDSCVADSEQGGLIDV